MNREERHDMWQGVVAGLLVNIAVAMWFAVYFLRKLVEAS